MTRAGRHRLIVVIALLAVAGGVAWLRHRAARISADQASPKAPAAASAAAANAASSPSPFTDVAQAAAEPLAMSMGISPQQLSGQLFARNIERWQTPDPLSGERVVRVPLQIVGPEMPLSVSFSVAGGVPFPMGQLPAGAAVRLQDEGGTIWPIQTRALATWDDGSIKWLLVTARMPEYARGRRAWLEYGASVASDAVPSPHVRVVETPERVVVTTGPIEFSVNKHRFALFDTAAVDSDQNGVFDEREQLATPGDLIVTRGATTFRSSQDTRTYTLTVEESGPLRATLKATGWFRDERGRGFGRFVVRIQAFAGLPQVRVSHTVIYTGYPANQSRPEQRRGGLPANEPIDGIRLELPVAVTANAELVTADDQGLVTAPLTAPTTMSQRAADAYQLRQETRLLRDSARNHGWMLVQDRDGGILVGLRDAWQQFPKELTADPVAKRLIIRLWPESAGPLNLETPASKASGSSASDAASSGHAFGLAKTHELTVAFLGAHVDPETAQAIATLWREPWLLAPDPSWVRETGVLGTLGPAQRDRMPDAERLLDELFGVAARQPEVDSWYGMLDYGDARGEGERSWENGDGAGLYTGALLQFLRTRDLRCFRYAEAAARHVMDVDTVHDNTVATDPRLSPILSERVSQVGAMHARHATHWGGRSDDASSTNVAGLLLYYYLTGSERAWDVAQEVGGFLLTDPVAPSTSDRASAGAIGQVLWGDSLLAEATHDPRFRRAADRWASVLIDGQQADGLWGESYQPSGAQWAGEPQTDATAASLLPALIAYHRMTGHPGAAVAIVRGVDALLRRDPRAPAYDSLAYAHQLTGQQQYLDEGLRRIQQLVAAPQPNGDLARAAGSILTGVPMLIGALDAPDFLTLQTALHTPRAAEQAKASDPLAQEPDAAPYEVVVMPSTEKLLLETGTMTGAHPPPAALSLARNEYEAVQLVIRSDAQRLRAVTVVPNDLYQTDGPGMIPRSAITWSLVGFVKTKKPDYPVSHVGWWPDPLPREAAFDVGQGVPQPIWLTLYASAAVAPGEYTGQIVIHPENAPAKSVRLVVRVWNFQLPATPTLKTAFDVYPKRIESAYSEFFPEWWQRWQTRGLGIGVLATQFYEDLVAHRLAPIMNVDMTDPGAIEALRRLRGLSAFGVGQHGGSFDNNWPDAPEELASLESLYRTYAFGLRETRMMERHYIYTYDEPDPGMPKVAQIAAMIHRADPELRNLVTLGALPADVDALADWFRDIDIVCVRNVGFNERQAERLRAMGKELWLYVSGPQPPYPTLAIDYPSMAYRVLPWMCWKYGIQGLLYWSVNFWTTNPYEDPMNIKREENGNGSLYYPGPEGPVSSIRLEVLRDGLEDYEYLARLRDEVTRVRLSADAMADPKAAPLVAEAEAQLRIDPKLVESMQRYSRDSAPLEQTRTRLAQLIEALQGFGAAPGPRVTSE